MKFYLSNPLREVATEQHDEKPEILPLKGIHIIINFSRNRIPTSRVTFHYWSSFAQFLD